MTKSKLKSLAIVGTAVISVMSAHAIGLQNATATYSQSFDRAWNVSESIDGVNAGSNGWAIFDATVSDHTTTQTAVYETVSDFTSGQITLGMSFLYGQQHLLGKFRLSATTDDRSTFADGLNVGGDVTANWTALHATAVNVGPGLSRSVLGDESILLTGTPPNTDTYDITFNLPMTGVTGFRLEVLEDSALPTNGPGLQPNGNFVLTELTVGTAVPEPSGLVALFAGAAVLLRRRSR